MEELNTEESGMFRPGRTLPLKISDFQNDGSRKHFQLEENYVSYIDTEEWIREALEGRRVELIACYEDLIGLKEGLIISALYADGVISEAAREYMLLPVHTVRERALLMTDYAHRLLIRQIVKLMNCIYFMDESSPALALYCHDLARLGIYLIVDQPVA